MSPDDMIESAVVIFNVPREILLNGCRQQPAVDARHALAYALYQRGHSYSAIGRLLHRDHTTVMYAVARAERLAAADYDYALDLLALLD